MTKKEIKCISNQIAMALIAPLRGVSKEHKYSWHVAEATLKGILNFVMEDSEVYYTSDKVKFAELNFLALYELAKAEQLQVFYSDVVSLSNELEKNLSEAIEESIRFGCITFTDSTEATDNNLPDEVIK